MRQNRCGRAIQINNFTQRIERMRKKTSSIPVNPMADEFGDGISIEKMSFTTLQMIEEGEQSHRHEGHAFFLLESGTIDIEIDFQNYTITAPSVMYVHPNQVHRTTAAESVTVSALTINNENLNPEYLKLLEGITPAKPLALQQETFSIISEAVSLCLKITERKTDKLYHSLLKDSCNALVAIVISQYLAQAKPIDKFSRFDVVTKAFRELLEHNYTADKRPASYAQKLHLSTPYLNECVKNTTGHSVSYHIQQRVILEANVCFIIQIKR